MKISLAWLFDHLQGDLHKVDVQFLVDQFNLKVAEIESFEKIIIKTSQFTVAKLLQNDIDCELFSLELKQNIQVCSRSDAKVGDYYLLKKLDLGWAWAGGKDFNSAKDNLLPALYFESDDAATNWSEQVDLQDYILEVDNKSLTHRPDMWGHRGFAREIGALLGLGLKPEQDFFAQVPVEYAKHSFARNAQNPFSLAINTSGCKSLAGLYLSNVSGLPVELNMAIRLFKVDMRSISQLVDLTNYVMLDIGQPMHVFDADLIAKNELLARQAHSHEKLVLLGGEQIELTHNDLVIADGNGPVSLAGIKGGASTGASNSTKNLLLESAVFDATVIRRSSAHHKIRTESSARYEKTLDPNQNILAIRRFVKLQSQIDTSLQVNYPIIALGEQIEPKQIELNHEFIQTRLGVKIATDFVVDILTKLGFQVVVKHDLVEQIIYQITVPTWRASKDINIAMDIVEEVARMWGYDKITPVLPSKITQPGNLDKVFRIRQIRQLLASIGMHEVENYPFYDETFLQAIKWQPQNAVEVRNPVSENWRRLVTSLLPHLCKNLQQESHDYSMLRYFEWGRIWYPKDAVSAFEVRTLAGVFFERSGVDFYVMKNHLVNLFNILHIDVVWQKPAAHLPIWYHPYQTAVLMHFGKQIGTAGKLSLGWMSNICEGEAFAFELDGDFILNQSPDAVEYKTISRYQPVCLDISLFVPLAVTVEQLQIIIKQADALIYHVELVDSFKKDDWLDKKALTFRYFFVDHEKTLSGTQIAVVQQQVEAAILKSGASVR